MNTLRSNMHTMSVVILFLAFVAMTSSQEACNFECDNKIMNPVCGSDDFTYPNNCQLLNSNCHPITGKVKVTVVKSGHCKGENTGCKDDCAGVPDNFVCGSDGMTYTNTCKMRLYGCQFASPTTVASAGKCT